MIWDCDNYKSSGPDGVSFGFIKQFWLDMKGYFMRFITDFHRNGKLVKGINSMFIALIPKIASPQRLNDFCPISLVRCMYKLLVKESRKISWVDWNSICLSKEEGGLGVRRLYEFNVSLLGKWSWRMLGEKDRLWYRVLKARYGEEEGRLKESGREISSWWQMMCGIRNGVGFGVGSWFEDNVRRVVGRGGDTYFWTDNWVGGVPLRVRFPRLFELNENRWETVENMERRGWEEGGDAWGWRRGLHAWEEESVT